MDNKKLANQALQKINNAKVNHRFKKSVPSPPNKKWKKMQMDAKLDDSHDLECKGYEAPQKATRGCGLHQTKQS